MITILEGSAPRFVGMSRGLLASGLSVEVAQGLDLGSMRAVRAAVAERRPSVVVMVAPSDDAEACEADPELAFRRNAETAINLAAAALEFAALPVFISSAEVFAGRRGPFSEADAPEPASVLAESLLRGENFLARAAKEHLILRVGVVLEDALAPEAARFRRGPVEAASDEPVSVVSAFELGRALAALLSANVRGTVHVAQPGPEVTRAGLLVRIAAALGLEAERVVARPGRALARAASRAPGPTLFTDRLSRVLSAPLPSWELSLAEAAQAERPRVQSLRSEAEGTTEQAEVRLLRASTDGEVRRLSTRVGPLALYRLEPGRQLSLGERLGSALTLVVISGKFVLEVEQGRDTVDHVLRAGAGVELAAGLRARGAAVEPSEVLLLGEAAEEGSA